jgi:hypothetical protein
MEQVQEAPRPQRRARDVADQEMYVTYDLAQRTRGGGTAIFPKVKRVYIPGDLVEWGVGHFRKRSGRPVYGVRITYEIGDEAAPAPARSIKSDTPSRNRTSSKKPTARRFTQVVDLPSAARNVQLHEAQRPGRGRVRAIR